MEGNTQIKSWEKDELKDDSVIEVNKLSLHDKDLEKFIKNYISKLGGTIKHLIITGTLRKVTLSYVDDLPESEELFLQLDYIKKDRDAFAQFEQVYTKNIVEIEDKVTRLKVFEGFSFDTFPG